MVTKEQIDNKITALTHYGDGKCACVNCGFDDIKALCIDHIFNDGKEHRRFVLGGKNIYKWLIENGFPPGFQTLCMNCNWIKYRQQRRESGRKQPKHREYPVSDINDNSVPKRARKLIAFIHNDPFRVKDIRDILPLSPKDSAKLRGFVHYLLLKGEIERVHGTKRWYRKTNKFK